MTENSQSIQPTSVTTGDVGGVQQTLTKENLVRFARGEITMAQLYGISMEQAYAVAELGYHLFEQGKLAEAQIVFEGLVLLNPHDGYFHSVLGSIFARKGESEKAYNCYTTALLHEPVDTQVFVNRAELLMNKGNFDEALADLREAMSRDPKGQSPAAVRAHALAEAALGAAQKILEQQKTATASAAQPKIKRKGV